MVNEALAAYLDAEKRLGRMSEDADPEAAAAMVLGACYQRAFFRSFLGEGMPAEGEEGFVEGSVRTSTFDCYETICRTHIIPALGG